MIYNLRADVIYYKSGSDFELEFNLCGCCRMRLLTDKPSTKKAFVHSLARAVSRSRVILISGPLFGEENTVQIVSQALGTTTEIVDNQAFNIASDEEIEIIKGSLPLVSSDGSFGGCIIESGPQTMILLTENKTLRKSIMSTLIHPYISDLYDADLQENTPTEDNEGNEDNTLEDIPTEDVTTEEADESIDKVDNIPLILPTEEKIPDNDIKPEGVLLDEPVQQPEEHEENKDITIDDLFLNSPKPEESTRTIEDNPIESQIILEKNKEDEPREFPEEYTNVFEQLFTNVDNTDDKDAPTLIQDDENYKFFSDNGDLLENTEFEFKKSKPAFNILVCIITVILLISIIILCYCIFSASANEGMAPTEYIKSVWETVFG